MAYKVTIEHRGFPVRGSAPDRLYQTTLTWPTFADPLYALRWSLRWAKGMKLRGPLHVLSMRAMTKAEIYRSGLFAKRTTRRVG